MSKWDPNKYDVEKAIKDQFKKGREVSFDDKAHVQKIDVRDDGTADVAWYAPNDSKKQHWHFVFKLDSNGNVIPGSGKMV
jgi:hypothetical protein